jgi:hypothetical protein
MDRFEEHLNERRNQRYASTRLWTPDPNKPGMIGERAVAKCLRAEPDMRNRPGGDGGIDIEALIRVSELDKRWIIINAKASPYGDWLRGSVGEVDPQTIYILVHVQGEDGTCVGWHRGIHLLQAPIHDLGHGPCHVHKQPRPMSELLDRYCGWWRHGGRIPRPAGGSGYCEDCDAPGLYLMFEGNVATGRKMWFCEEHRTHG